MSVRNLDHLFRPSSVALIGASTRAGSVGAVVARNLLRSGFTGPVMPVNPRHRAVEGVLAYPDITSLPLTPDLAIICTPPPTVPGLVAELGARGTRAAVVLTAGMGHAAADDRGPAAGDARRRAAAPAAHPRPELPRRPGAGLGLNASFAHTLRLTGRDSPSSRSRAPWSPRCSTGRRPAASASRTSSRWATWPTSISATCSISGARSRDARDPAVRRGHHPGPQVHVGRARRARGTSR